MKTLKSRVAVERERERERERELYFKALNKLAKKARLLIMSKNKENLVST